MTTYEAKRLRRDDKILIGDIRYKPLERYSGTEQTVKYVAGERIFTYGSRFPFFPSEVSHFTDVREQDFGDSYECGSIENLLKEDG